MSGIHPEAPYTSGDLRFRAAVNNAMRKPEVRINSHYCVTSGGSTFFTGSEGGSQRDVALPDDSQLTLFGLRICIVRRPGKRRATGHVAGCTYWQVRDSARAMADVLCRHTLACAVLFRLRRPAMSSDVAVADCAPLP